MKPMMGLFEIIFLRRRFLELHGTERLQNKFLEALVSIEGAPDEELFYQKQVWCSTVITFKCHNVRQ